MKTKERGITLIALVVTIIVLLILAGVSIQMIAGQSGILNQARQAKEETTKGQIKENVRREIMEKMTEKYGEDLTAIHGMQKIFQQTYNYTQEMEIIHLIWGNCIVEHYQGHK